MQTLNIETIITLVMMVSTGFLGWMQWKSKTSLDRADQLHKIGNTYDVLLKNMRNELDALKKKVEHLEEQYQIQLDHNRLLVKQLYDAGLEPVSINKTSKEQLTDTRQGWTQT